MKGHLEPLVHHELGAHRVAEPGAGREVFDCELAIVEAAVERVIARDLLDREVAEHHEERHDGGVSCAGTDSTAEPDGAVESSTTDEPRQAPEVTQSLWSMPYRERRSASTGACGASASCRAYQSQALPPEPSETLCRSRRPSAKAKPPNQRRRSRDSRRRSRRKCRSWTYQPCRSRKPHPPPKAAPKPRAKRATKAKSSPNAQKLSTSQPSAPAPSPRIAAAAHAAAAACEDDGADVLQGALEDRRSELDRQRSARVAAVRQLMRLLKNACADKEVNANEEA